MSCEYCGCTDQHINKQAYETLASELGFSDLDFKELTFSMDPDTSRPCVWFTKDATEVGTPYYLEQQEDLTWVVREDKAEEDLTWVIERG